MSSELANQVADAINEDRLGANYYEDVKILSAYLKGQFGATPEAALDAADAILRDRAGADYYADPDILASFLDGQFAVTN